MMNLNAGHEPEGVIKFNCLHADGPLPTEDGLPQLLAWRRILHGLGLIGQTPERYDGYGFGNISVRAGESGFLITGTQTGAPPELTPQQCVMVTAWDTRRNEIRAQGPVRPSSESMTHAVLYELDPSLGCVMHAHCPDIWHKGEALGLPATRSEVPYGTPEMAEEVRRLWRETDASSRGVFIMAGHEDGVVSYGADAMTAGNILIDHLARAYALEHQETRR